MGSDAFVALVDGLSDHDDDRVLIAAAREAPSAFAAIYTRYARRVYLYVRSRAPSDEDAMDITQQVFLKALKALPGFREGEAPLSAWLFRIARNAVIDYQRRTKFHSTLDGVPALLREPSAGPEDSAVQAEDIQRLRSALATLDSDRRDLLALRFGGGLKMRDIALVTGKSEDSTKKRIARTLKTLRERYDELS